MTTTTIDTLHPMVLPSRDVKAPQAASPFQKLWKTEDWWSVWLGLGTVLLALVTFYGAGWKVMQDFNVEAPLLALILGLAISNAAVVPEWLKTSLRTEYYIKTGIVLLLS